MPSYGVLYYQIFTVPEPGRVGLFSSPGPKASTKAGKLTSVPCTRQRVGECTSGPASRRASSGEVRIALIYGAEFIMP